MILRQIWVITFGSICSLLRWQLFLRIFLNNCWLYLWRLDFLWLHFHRLWIAVRSWPSTHHWCRSGSIWDIVSLLLIFKWNHFLNSSNLTETLAWFAFCTQFTLQCLLLLNLHRLLTLQCLLLLNQYTLFDPICLLWFNLLLPWLLLWAQNTCKKRLLRMPLLRLLLVYQLQLLSRFDPLH